MPDKEVSKDMNKDADTVLSTLVYSPENPKRLRYPACGFEYYYLQDLFKFIVERCPGFVEIYAGTKPFAHIKMHASSEQNIKDFINNGGFEKFDNFIAYKRFEQAAKTNTGGKVEFVVNGNMINNQTAIGGQASVFLDGNNGGINPTTNEIMAENNKNSPLDRPDGWRSKAAIWCMNNIGKIIIAIISGIILSIIKACYDLK